MRLNRRMDAALQGHAYVKSGIDMACWDLLGQATGMPVCELLGGRFGEEVSLYRAISQESPDAMAAKVAGYRAKSYHRFQLTVGGGTLDVAASAKLAQQYVKQKKFKEGAELFEKIAPLDKGLAAWHWKESAQAWIKAKDKLRARDAAKSAVAAGPEKRGDLLLHFWHRALGQVFLETGEPTLAIEHLEAAINSTTIDGFIKECNGELATAKEAVAKLEKK